MIFRFDLTRAVFLFSFGCGLCCCRYSGLISVFLSIVSVGLNVFLSLFGIMVDVLLSKFCVM